MSKELLLEIGTEELPPGFIAPALEGMDRIIRKELKDNRIAYRTVYTLGTPRRLVLVVEGLEEKQEDIFIQSIGPKKSVAYDEKGNPTKAAFGFAKGQGIEVDQLEVIQTEKGEYVGIKKEAPGRESRELLSSILPRLISAIPFRKSMRWGSSDIRFARPVHWIVAIYGGKVVPLELGDIKSGNTSRGHRFMSPESLPVKDFADYSKKMRDAYVIVDPKERKEMILKETARMISFTSGRILEDEKLLNLLTYLVEYPTAICGTFDKEFLRLPREVLIACMREHQKYFSVVDKDGNLLPNFVAINNTLPQDPEVAIKGNERVLKARLSDARFFFEEDRKIPLAGWVEKLRGVLFQENLGSYHEKIERLQKLAEYLAEEVNPVIKKKVKRASLLCKADLVTGMVGEFPGLQGVMGREYALLSKEEKEVAKAIREHYFPAFAGDILPSSQTGALLSIADKTDTIVGCFGVNLLPTGAADPYALRRQALGIINIVLENKYSLSLHKLLNKSLSLLEDKIARKPLEVKRDVQEFFRIRFKNLLIPKGFPPEVVEAVTLVSFDNLVDVFEKIKAVDEFRSHPDFESLVTAFKRASRIIEKSPLQEVDATLFESSEEGRLFKVYRDVQNKVGELFEGERYRDALTEIVKLKEPIDTFFDRVMVMAEEREIRENRLALLGGIVNLFMNIADFSRIATSREKEG